MRLLELPADKSDPDPKAIAYYGLWLKGQQQMLLRFVERRPVSESTCAFLEWVCYQLAQASKQVLVLIWDNATWYLSKHVRQWIAVHNVQVSSRGVFGCWYAIYPSKVPGSIQLNRSRCMANELL